MDATIVYLIPVGHERFELYSETPDEMAGEPPRPGDPGWRHMLHRMQQRWHEAVEAAQRAHPSAGWFARLRDRTVRRAAETIAEQRTLWSLRQCDAATIIHPSDLSDQQALTAREHILAAARRHHGLWLIIDTILFVASGALMLVPGPNVLAYYFAFRLVGHYLSWRGARQGIDRIQWRQRGDSALAELGRLATEPRDARAPRVRAIAASLNLPRLAAFFDRTAIESNHR